jgi:adenine-specific DNA-methyltransferase
MARLDAAGQLIYPTGNATRIRIKKYLQDQEEWAPASVFYKDRSGASAAMKALMGAEVFDNPKSVDVLARWIHAITDDGDLIVDFFAGSGSTGHAVWQQNVSDGQARHWLMVQEPVPPNPSEATGAAAIEAGYSTIFEITADRMRRASAALTSETGPLEFRVFRAHESNLVMDPPIVVDETTTGESYVQTTIAQAAGPPVIEGADPLAVAWEVVLKATATRLDARVNRHRIGEVSVYEFTPAADEVKSGRLMVSLDAFDLDTADELKIGADDTVILRGDRVADSTTLTLAPRCKLVLLERVPREVSL